MIHVAEHHDELLHLWREEDRRGIRLAHVDFHDDLRGLLVDRRRGRAAAIGALARGEAPLDPGNFLAHAVLEGRVESVRWVHGAVGGRAWDMGIVRYESDLAAWPHRLARLLRGGPEVPLRFEERCIDRWSGPDPGELLSVDWDCFASILLDAEGVERRAGEFLEALGDPVPPDSYLVYSPEYSRPTLEAFTNLAETLGRRFDQPLRWTRAEFQAGRTSPTSVQAGLPHDPWSRLILALRRRGLY